MFLDHREEDEILLANLRTGDWLDSIEFPPLRYAIPELLPEGFTLLAGSPKVGKSWLVLDMLLSVAGAGKALSSIPVLEPRPVLYLTLEDGERRLQDRCRKVLDGRPVPANFHFMTRCDHVHSTISAWLERFPGAIIVLDTLGKVMEDTRQGESPYQRDYRIAGEFKRHCDRHDGVSLLVVHHDRKLAASDFVQSVSGTNGIAGAADTVMILNRDRNSDDGLLKVTGRDVLEAEYALSRSGPVWRLQGGSLDSARQAADTVRNSMKVSGLGDRTRDILDRVKASPEGITARQIDDALGIDNARTYLARLSGQGLIDRCGRGIYVPVASVATLQAEPTEVTLQHLQHDFMDEF